MVPPLVSQLLILCKTIDVDAVYDTATARTQPRTSPACIEIEIDMSGAYGSLASSAAESTLVAWSCSSSRCACEYESFVSEPLPKAAAIRLSIDFK